MIASAESAMDLQRAFDGKVATLDSDRKYLVHLILHEIAYFMLNTPEQEPRMTGRSRRCQTMTPNPSLNADAHRRAFSPPAVAG